MPSILYLADDLMFPTNSGGRLELLGGARALVRSGATLRVVVVHRDELDDNARVSMREEFPGTTFVQREPFIRATLRHPLQPYQLASRLFDPLPLLRQDSAIDAVVASHEYMLPVARTIADATGAVVLLRSHNDEVAYSRSLVEHASGIKRVYLVAELLRLRRAIGRGLLNLADAVALISESDRNAYAEFSGPVEYVPPSLSSPEGGIIDAPPSVPVIGFLGALDSSHTEHGLAWFVRSVLPLVRDSLPEARLIVAGRRPTPDLAKLLSASDGVDFMGEVEDPRELYEKIRVFINPIFSGSGVNMKLGGPAQRGIPIVTTSFGVRGLDSLAEAAFIADDATRFAEGNRMLLGSDAEWSNYSFAGRSALDAHRPARVAAAFFALMDRVRQRRLA